MAEKGEPVVLVHGLSGSTRWWSRNIPALAEHYSVYLLDLPGFGAMRRLRRRFVLAEAASWLSAWMEAVGLDSAHLVGHSMGGYVCVRLAARPIRVHRSLFEAAEQPDRGVVHPHVDPAEVLDGAFVGHVRRHGQRPPSLGLALGGRLQQGLFPPGGQDHAGALPGEGQGRGAAVAA